MTPAVCHEALRVEWEEEPIAGHRSDRLKLETG